jgi:hypothetical protein
MPKTGGVDDNADDVATLVDPPRKCADVSGDVRTGDVSPVHAVPVHDDRRRYLLGPIPDGDAIVADREQVARPRARVVDGGKDAVDAREAVLLARRVENARPAEEGRPSSAELSGGAAGEPVSMRTG